MSCGMYDIPLTISKLAFTSSSQKVNLFCDFSGLEFSLKNKFEKACKRDSNEADMLPLANQSIQ